MELPQAQARVADFVRRHDLEVPVAARLLDLVSEVGELAKEALNGSTYGTTPLALPESWTGELADVLFAVLCLANTTGVDLDAALRTALDKYARRIAAHGTAGSTP